MAKQGNKPLSDLERLVGDPGAIISLMLWQGRITNPDMAIAIGPKDRDGMRQSMEYLGVEPEVRIFVRGERVLVALVDKKSKITVRRQITVEVKGKPVIQDQDVDLEPGAKPERGENIVSIGNGIRPIENTEQDFESAATAARVRQAKSNGMILASQIKDSALAGTFSKELVVELCDNYLLLGRQA